MISCSPVKSVSYNTSCVSKLSSSTKLKKARINKLMARPAKLEQLTPVSSPEQNSSLKRSTSPLCAKMQFDEEEEDSSCCSTTTKSEVYNQEISNKGEQRSANQVEQQQLVNHNQTTTPQSPLSNSSSSPSSYRNQETNSTKKIKSNSSPVRTSSSSSSPPTTDAQSMNNSNSINNQSPNANQLTAHQLNSPNSPAVSVSSTCSSLTNSNANATPHGINDILKKNSQNEAIIDNHLSVFAGLASTFTNNQSPKLAGNTSAATAGSQLAHATSALAAAVANRFYFNQNNTNPATNSSSSPVQQPQQNSKTLSNQSNLNSNNQTNSNTGGAVNAVVNNSPPPRVGNNNALKLNLNDLSSRQFYWQQMVQNQALWQERFSAAVNNVTNANSSGANNAYSPLTNSSLINHCNEQTTPAQSDPAFNCKLFFRFFLM